MISLSNNLTNKGNHDRGCGKSLLAAQIKRLWIGGVGHVPIGNDVEDRR